MANTSFPTVLDGQVNETSSVAQHRLGATYEDQDGRQFRYGKAGATNVSKGKLQTAPAPVANHANLTVAAAALGDKKVTVTLGATAATADEYADGYMVVNDVDGEGATYKIAGHAAVASAGTGTINLAEPIRNVALTANSQVTLVHNNYNGVIEGTSTSVQPAGIPIVSVTAGEYAWFQTRGVCSALAGATVAVGSDIVADGTTAGAVAGASATIATNIAQIKVGNAIVAGVATEYRPVYLQIG